VRCSVTTPGTVLRGLHSERITCQENPRPLVRIRSILGFSGRTDAIHRDDLVERPHGGGSPRRSSSAATESARGRRRPRDDLVVGRGVDLRPGEGSRRQPCPPSSTSFAKTILRFLRRAPCIRVTWLLYDQRDGDRGAAVTFFMKTCEDGCGSWIASPHILTFCRR
jgi:hypothetical protein